MSIDIKSFGCSLIFGTDLPDCRPAAGRSQRASRMTWPALIASKIGSSYRCRAHGGSGNLCTLNRILDSAHDGHGELYIIGWTFIDRFDYSDTAGRHYNRNLNDYLTLCPQSDDAITDFYYRNLHSEFRDKFTNLIYLHTAINMLQKTNIPFVMTSLDDLLFDQRWHVSPAILALQEQIKPHMMYFEGMNFLDWSRHHGFPISDSGHPLDKAHQAAADLMMPIIESILHRA